MTLPAEWPVVEVRVGPYFGTDGRPLEGERVQFEPRVKRLLLLDETTIVRTITTVTLDADGKAVAELPVSDDPDISMNGWTWQVREKFRWGQSYDIDVLTSDVAAGIDLAERAPVAENEPRYPGLALQVNGYEDHGPVSGTLLVDPDVGTHVLDATDALLVTIGEALDGRIVTLLVTSGAADVTVDDVEGTLTDGGFATFVRVRGVWALASSGAAGEVPVPDLTPPSAITDLVLTPGDNQIGLAWSARTDAESTVHYRYRAWPSAGAPTGPWTTTNSTSATITGLDPGSYTVEVYSYSSGGTTSPDFDTVTVTGPPPAGTILDDFTGADNANVAGRTPAGASGPWVNSTVFAACHSGSVSPIIVSNRALRPHPSDITSGVEVGYPIANGETVTVGIDYALNGGGDANPAMQVAFGDADEYLYLQIRDVGVKQLMLYRYPDFSNPVSITDDTLPANGRIELSWTRGTGAYDAKLNGVSKGTGTIALALAGTPLVGFSISRGNGSALHRADNFSAVKS